MLHKLEYFATRIQRSWHTRKAVISLVGPSLFCMADGSPAAYGRICFRNHAGMKEDRHIKPSK